MTEKILPVTKVWFISYVTKNENGNEKTVWEITNDEDFAKTVDPNCRLATLDEVNEYVKQKGGYFGDIIELEDGFGRWVEILPEKYKC
ncbi:hypothetical protein BSNK01_06830 [Bacillaceae bacterium]